MKQRQTCEHCGHTTYEYKHKINKPLISALYQLYMKGQPTNLQKGLILSKNQYNNFQKLQYFKLVEKVKGTSLWFVTEKGKDFCDGYLSILDTAYTFGKAILQKETDNDNFININDYPDIQAHYRTREEYLGRN